MTCMYAHLGMPDAAMLVTQITEHDLDDRVLHMLSNVRLEQQLQVVELFRKNDPRTKDNKGE